MQVDFMLIGAQKCGTTTLANQLASHPGICFCREKEPGYFNSVEDWQAGLDAYHALYEPRPGQLCGEDSTMYTFLPEFDNTHARLHAYNPDLKFIYVMRHPVERVISNYAHRLVRNTVDVPPEEAVFAKPEYVNRSRYGVQLRPYVKLFGRERILLLVFEEYIRAPMATLARIADYLEIDPAGFESALNGATAAHSSTGEYYWGNSVQKFRSTAAGDRLVSLVPDAVRSKTRQMFGRKLDEKPVFSPTLKQLIWRFVEDDVAYVEELMGRRLDIWREGYST